jgi:hypothetical protein
MKPEKARRRPTKTEQTYIRNADEGQQSMMMYHVPIHPTQQSSRPYLSGRGYILDTARQSHSTAPPPPTIHLPTIRNDQPVLFPTMNLPHLPILDTS